MRGETSPTPWRASGVKRNKHTPTQLGHRTLRDRDSSHDSQGSASSTDSYFSFLDAQSRTEIPTAHSSDGFSMAQFHKRGAAAANPSSQSRSEPEHNAVSEGEEYVDDLLDGFDVDANEREFLQEMLRMAPPDEIQLLHKAKHDSDPDFSKPVRDFATSHPFYTQRGPVIDQDALAQFQRDVFAFSRATGLGRNKAKADVMLVTAAWKKEMGFGGVTLDEMDTESEPEMRGENTEPELEEDDEHYLNGAQLLPIQTPIAVGESMGKKKRKRNRNKPRIPGEGLAKCADAPVATADQKRKRDSLGGTVPQDKEGEETAAKRQRIELKRARKKAKKLERQKQKRANAAAARAAERATGVLNALHLAALRNADAPTQPILEPTESRKKKSKPGPTTSSYFSHPKIQDAEGTGPVAAGKTANTRQSIFNEGARKAERIAALRPSENATPGVDIAQLAKSAIDSFDFAAESEVRHTTPIPQPMIVDNAVVDTQLGHQLADEVNNVEAKRKRKRKRNHNKLSGSYDELSGPSVNAGGEIHSQSQIMGRGTSEPSVPRPQRPSENSPEVIRLRYEVNQGEATRADTEAPPKRKRGDRGRASRGRNSQGDLETLGRDIAVPLAELENTNGSGQKLGRRDRGRKRSSVAARDTDSQDQQLKGRRSSDDDIEDLEVSRRHTRDGGGSGTSLGQPSAGSRVEVVIYTQPQPSTPNNLDYISYSNASDEEDNEPEFLPTNRVRPLASTVPKRDCKGRFSSGPVGVNGTPLSKNEKSERRSRARSRPETVPSSQKRNSKGRFSSGHAMEGTPTSQSARARSRRRSREAPSSLLRSVNASAQKRDASGRFSGSFISVENTAPAHSSRGRSKSRSVESSGSVNRSVSASCPQRDSKGRFARRASSTTGATPIRKRPEIKATEESESIRRSKQALLQKRTSGGRFSSGHIKPDTAPTRTEPRARSADGLEFIRSKQAASQKRSSGGRFSRGYVAAEPAPTQDEILEEGSQRGGISPHAESQNQESNRHLGGSPILAGSPSLEQEMEFLTISRSSEGEPAQGNEETVTIRPLSRPKKGPAKSPYFAPTPSPQRAEQSIVQNPKEIPETPESATHPKSPRTPKSRTGQETPKKPRTPGGVVSCIPFPPLAAPHFGLIQEKLAHDPFRLLVAVTFLIRTHGKHAIPVFYELMEKYPTPESLVNADKDEIVPIIRHLGLQNQRASTYQAYAKIWLKDPPIRGKRYAVRDYPTKGSGRDVKKDEILPDEDERVGWEIGHMTQGPYAIDSWRIFCRDELRGLAKDWNGEDAPVGFQPEWMRVLPEDKELRAYLRWMWLKEGFEWDPFTGDKEVASARLMRAAIDGRIAWDDMGGMRILDDMEDADGAVLQQGEAAREETPDEDAMGNESTDELL